MTKFTIARAKIREVVEELFVGCSKRQINDYTVKLAEEIQSLAGLARLSLEMEKGLKCHYCKGSGVNPKAHLRYTSGGHDDRSCPKCNGDGDK